MTDGRFPERWRVNLWMGCFLAAIVVAVTGYATFVAVWDSATKGGTAIGGAILCVGGLAVLVALLRITRGR